ARATPRFTCSAQTFTGAAQTWLVVNMPATVAGTSDTIRARSRFAPLFDPLPVPRRLMSQNTPLATNPRGAKMEPDPSVNLNFMWGSSVRMESRDATGLQWLEQSRRLRIAAHDVHALD